MSMKQRVVAHEYQGEVQIASLTADGALSHSCPHSSISQALRDAFLPVGYPESVTPDYLGFQLWDTVQALSSYVRGMLTTHALLTGVGVGSQAATPLSAALQFFVRDFVGMLGGVTFAALKGSSFDGLAKQWRLTADVTNDIGLTLELAAPLFPSFFLVLACIGALCRAVTGVAGGATRFALTQHFALRHNAADVAAKEGSQETATTLIGMALGVGLTKLAAVAMGWAWLIFWIMTVVHVWANIKALRCLKLTNFNRPRLNIVLQHYLRYKKVLKPEELSQKESLMPPPLVGLLCGLGLRAQEPDIRLAPSLSSLGEDQRAAIIDALNGYTHLQALSSTSSPSRNTRSASKFHQQQEKQQLQKRYCVLSASNNESKKNRVVTVLLHRDAQAMDLLEAYCIAYSESISSGMNSHTDQRLDSLNGGEYRSKSRFAIKFPEFIQEVKEAGWRLTSVALLQGQFTLDWGGLSDKTE